MSKYDAFVSYSHAKDKPLARQLQHVIQRLGKPWYKRRAARIFRDDTSLTATPELWPSIVEALEQSRYLILLASPEAGHSPWVNKEVDWWLANKGVDTLLIGLTAGDLRWDPPTNRFAQTADMPLPPALHGNFTAEPLWIDLREWRENPGAARKSTHFKSLGSKFAARIRGVPPEDLWSEELRQQRANLRLAGGAIAGLIALAALSVYGFIRATNQERIANENSAIAQMQLALVQAERGITLGAITSALIGYDTGKRAGLAENRFEPELYAVSSKTARGLVAAANITFADPHAKGVEVIDISFQPGGTIVCATVSNYTADHGGEFDTCFTFKDDLIQWAENVALKEPHPVARPIELIAAADAGKVSFYKRKEDNSRERGELVYTLRTHVIGRPNQRINAFQCPSQPYIIVNALGNASETGHTQNVYTIDTTSDRLTEWKGEFAEFACSPTTPLMISSERYGNVRIHNLAGGFTNFEPVRTLSKSAATIDQVAFSPDGLALLPSMLKLNGTWTKPKLVPAYGIWKTGTLELPLWQGAPGTSVALSPDSRYAAIVFGDEGTNILTIWDVAGLGMMKSDDPARSNTEEEARQAFGAAKEGADKMWKSVANPEQLPCAFYNGTGHQITSYGPNRVLVYDFKQDKVVSDDKNAKFLFPGQGDIKCKHELERAWIDQAVQKTPDASLKALCANVTVTARDCNLYSTTALPAWLNDGRLKNGCWLIYSDDRFWICAPNGFAESPQKTLTVLDWKIQRTTLINHEFFEHIFESKHGLSDFTIRVNETCARASFTYENVMSGGGVPQPDGAMIFDLTTGSVVAHVTDTSHKIYCATGDLARFMKRQLERYTPRSIHVDKIDLRPHPRE